MLRGALESFGPLSVKIGRELSLRADFLPDAAIRDLLLLDGEVRPESWDVISGVISEDLGRAPEQLFERVKPSPFASDGLTQIHHAVTRGGESVAVKVQRPDALAGLERQLKNLDRVHSKLEAIEGCHPPDIDVLRGELANALHGALDFDHAARNMTLLESAAPLANLRLPVVYPEYSGSLVLSSEYLDGVPLDKLLNALADGDTSPFEIFGLDGEELGDNLVCTTLQQAFAPRPFSVSPIPANLVAMAGNVVGVVDVGQVDKIDTADLKRFLALVHAVHHADTARTIDAAVDLVDGPVSGREAFRDDFIEESRRWRQQTTLDDQDDAEVIKHQLRTILQLSLRHDLTMSPPVVAGSRTLIVADTIATLLSRGSGLASVGRPFFAREQIKVLARELSLDSLQGFGLDVVGLATEAPGQVQRLVGELADDRFIFRVSTTESPTDRTAANRRARLVTAAIIFVGLALLTARAADVGVALTVIFAVLAGAVLAVIGVLWAGLE